MRLPFRTARLFVPFLCLLSNLLCLISSQQFFQLAASSADLLITKPRPAPAQAFFLVFDSAVCLSLPEPIVQPPRPRRPATIDLFAHHPSRSAAAFEHKPTTLPTPQPCLTLEILMTCSWPSPAVAMVPLMTRLPTLATAAGAEAVALAVAAAGDLRASPMMQRALPHEAPQERRDQPRSHRVAPEMSLKMRAKRRFTSLLPNSLQRFDFNRAAGHFAWCPCHIIFEAQRF